MMTRRKASAVGHDNLDRWLLTYADMITLLTAFFIMLYAMSVMSRGKFVQIASSVRGGFGGGVTEGGNGILPSGKIQSAHSGEATDVAYQHYRSAVQDLNKFVEQQKLKGVANVRSDERGVIISLLSDGMLFQRGGAGLQPGSDELLHHVTDIIGTLPNHIQVEGHTCDLPIHTLQFPSNWELSTSRAGTILRYFTEQAGLPAIRFSAAGYADTRPLVSNTSEERRARNRRVDIVILKTEAQREADLLRQGEIRRVRSGTDQSASPDSSSSSSGNERTHSPDAPTDSSGSTTSGQVTEP